MLIKEPDELPVKSPEMISAMFNRIAKTYDLLNDCMTMGLHRQWKLKACKMLNLKPGDSVLDLCTGTGDLAFMLSNIVGKTGEVTAVDFSTEMLEIAQNRFSKKAPNIRWVHGDALKLPFENNRFNGAVISFGLRNVASVDQALSEMIRVIKPGGWVVNLDTASDCKNPIFWFYFSVVMPMLGRYLAKDPQAYRYLCRSAKTFDTPQQIADSLKNLGLQNTEVRHFAIKSVSCQRGLKSNQ